MRSSSELGKLLREAGFRPIPVAGRRFVIPGQEADRPTVVSVVGNGSAHFVSVLVPIGRAVPRTGRLWDILRVSLEMDLWKMCLAGDQELAFAVELPPEQVTPLLLRATVALGQDLAQLGGKELTRTVLEQIVNKTRQAYQTDAVDGTVEWLVAAEIANWQIKESVGNNALLSLDGLDVMVRQLGSMYGAYLFTELRLPRSDWLFLVAVNRVLDGCKVGFTEKGELVLAAEMHAPIDEVSLIHLVHSLMQAAKSLVPVARYLASQNSTPGARFWSRWCQRLFGL